MSSSSAGTTRRFFLGGTALLLALAAAACGSSGSSSTTPKASAAPKAGGSLTVLEGAGFAGDWPDGLDPATNINGAADQSYMDAVYGELFELGPKGAIVNDLATATASSATPRRSRSTSARASRSPTARRSTPPRWSGTSSAT